VQTARVRIRIRIQMTFKI